MSTDIQLSVEFGVSVLQKIVDAGYEFLNTEQNKRDIFDKATERYVEGLIERFGEVRAPGMYRPVALRALDIRVNISEKIGARTVSLGGEAIINDLQRCIVLGKPGSGKTTFLKYLALAMIDEQRNIRRRRLPVFITLRDWVDKKCSVKEFVAGQFQDCYFEQSETLAENLLRQGACLILFDGLDEIGGEPNFDGIIRDIRDFTDRYFSNQFAISCRTAAYNHWFERFTIVEIADFDEAQMEQFVRNWFHSESQTADVCITRLQNSPQLSELSSIPLLLALLCNTYAENGDFPANRADLYEEAIQILLKKWDDSKLIRRNDLYKQLSLRHKQMMFARIAIGAFRANRYSLHERELVKTIGNYINDLPEFKQENIEVDGTEILHNIEVQHGIFTERPNHMYEFAHVAFQEYFTAKYIVDNDNTENRELEKLAQEHLYDDKWKEVFLLVAGMLTDADELLLLMLKKNQELLHEPFLNHFLEMVEQALLPGENKCPDAMRKAMVILSVFAGDISCVRDLTEQLSLALASDIDLDRIFFTDIDLDFDPALGIDVDYVRNTIRRFADNIHLAPDMANNPPMQFLENMNLYIKGNVLIANCLQTAANLSQAIRGHVLKEMLAPLKLTKAAV